MDFFNSDFVVPYGVRQPVVQPYGFGMSRVSE